MKKILYLVIALSAFVAASVSAETIEIQLSKKKLASAKSSEKITLSGNIHIIPMFGATYILSSRNFGDVVLFKRFADDTFSETTDKRLEALDGARSFVEVTGTLRTVCTKAELKRDVGGCREFDTTKPIMIKIL